VNRKFAPEQSSAAVVEYMDLSAIVPTGPGAGIIASITDAGDGFYRINLIDMTENSLQRDHIRDEAAFLVEALTGDADDLAKLFGHQVTLETRLCTTKPDIFVAAVLCDPGLATGVAVQHDEYPTNGHYTSKRNVASTFGLGAAGQGGTGATMIMKGIIQNLPTGADMQWSWFTHLIGETAEPNANQSAQGEQTGTTNVGSPMFGIAVGCKEADLGAGEFVEVRVGRKPITWD
jgi:hypothetical protein